MEFKPDDFKKLKYNCYPLSDKTDLLQSFPDLSRYPEFTEPLASLDKNKVMRYVIYNYDKASPLLLEKNFIKRKMLSAKLAGFKMEGDKYPEKIEDMLRGKNEQVNRMICCYIRQQNSVRYTMLATGLESFYNNIERLRTPTPQNTEDLMDELNKKTKLYQETVKMMESLESYAAELFNDETQLIYTVDETEQIDRGKIRSYPEYVASLKEDGEISAVFATMEKSNQV